MTSPVRPNRPWSDRVRPSRSLAARIVLWVSALVLVVQALSFTTIRSGIDGNARRLLDADLGFAATLTGAFLAQEVTRLTKDATLYAKDHGFLSAVLDSGDAGTIESNLEGNALRRTGAGVAAVLGTTFELRAVTGTDRALLGPLVGELTHAVERGAVSPAAVAVIDERPMQFVMVPVRNLGLHEAWLLMGFALDERLGPAMAAYSRVRFVMGWQPVAGGAWRLPKPEDGRAAPDDAPGPVRAAASDDPERIELQTASLGAIATLLATPGRPATLGFAGGEHRALVVPLGNSAQPVGGRVAGVLTRSLDEAVAPYRALQVGLLLITLVAMATVGVGSIFAARRVTTPIRSLAAAADRVAAGDYATPLDTTGRGADEIGDLARAFEHMRGSIASHEAEVRRLAYWDSLTRLPNRTHFAEAARALVAGRATPQAAVIMLDLDRFKHVNDVLGYAVGDLLLVQVAERLRESVADHAPGTLLARLSGDEFAVLVPGADADAAMALARAIEHGFAQPLLIEDQTIDLSAGIGVACWPLHAADAGTLLSRAEVAMYAAKRRTSGPMLYDPAVDAASAQTLSLLSELRHAVEHGELRLFLQPKIALADGRVIGAEALVRWQHPERGMVPPMAFIPFAEQTGFVRTLTMWVIEETCRRQRDFRAAGLELRISVNLSTRDLVDQRLPERIEGLLARYGTPASAFCLEITESAIMDDPERAQATLERLHRLGFKLSIDDFGTGYSSLAYLKRLPVDELKIDKSFVFGMETDPDDAKIVRSTIDLAHNLSLTVVAEGVENDAVWKMLQRLSCDEGQGYHFAKPMAADQFLAWVAARAGTAPVAAETSVAG